MKIIIWSVGLAVLLVVAPAQAQTANIPVPDTLGANFADTTDTATADAFAYLIGEWDFRFQTRRQDGTWRADGSSDGGRTWTRDVSRMEATRTK